MKKACFIILCLLQSFLVNAQDTAAIQPGFLLSDLEVLVTTIKENHPMMDAYISRDSFERMSQQVVEDIGGGMTRQAFHASLSHLLQAIGCGHTYAFATRESIDRLDWMNDLPFEFLVTDTTLFLWSALKPEYQQFVGAEIYSINDHPVNRILQAAYALISSDGYNTTYKAFTFQRYAKYYLNQVLDNPDSLNIKSSAGNWIVRFPTLFIKPPAEELETHFSEWKDVPGTVLLSVPGFDDGKNRIKECFKYMAVHQTKNLVVDLRDNGGGNGNIGAYLVSYIVDTTLTYYLDKKSTPMQYKDYLRHKEGFIFGGEYVMSDSITRSYIFKVKPKAKNNFDGKVYIITNGGTFSTGSYVASALKYKAGATSVGEETGGSAYGLGGGVIGRLILPYTGINVRFPLYRWRFNLMADNLGAGVLPDVPVIRNPDVIRSKADLELIAVQKMILEGLPSGG